jgi:allantoinase
VKLLIRGGKLVLPTGTRPGSVLCEDGRIARVLEPDEPGHGADKILEADGLLVFPGFIDPHIHSRDPGLTDKETFGHATRAAVAGGVTCVFDMPNTMPPLARAALVAERAAAHEQHAYTDFGLWAIALGVENLDELPGLIGAGAVGVKLFWGYGIDRRTGRLAYSLDDVPDEDMIVPPDNAGVRAIFAAVATAGGLLAAHCEDRALVIGGERALGRPPEAYDDLLLTHPDAAEPTAIALGIEFAEQTGCAFHVVHVTSARGVELVRRAQRNGAPVTAETCPHYLTLTNESYSEVGGVMKIFPPIRRADDQHALWRGVLDGTICSIGSDHAPHTASEKQRPLGAAPAGFVGVETLGPLLVSEMSAGRITPEQLASLLSEGTARRFGFAGRKGVVAAGSDADLTLVDPHTRWRVRNDLLHSKHPLSPWHGRELVGRPRVTVVGGRIVMREGDVDDVPHGRFVRPERSR